MIYTANICERTNVRYCFDRVVRALFVEMVSIGNFLSLLDNEEKKLYNKLVRNHRTSTTKKALPFGGAFLVFTYIMDDRTFLSEYYKMKKPRRKLRGMARIERFELSRRFPDLLP